jgi:putative endonuclease
MKRFWVYIVASRKNGTLYAGVTSDLARRAFELREGTVEGFTSRHSVKRLVWYEERPSPAPKPPSAARRPSRAGSGSGRSA